VRSLVGGFCSYFGKFPVSLLFTKAFCSHSRSVPCFNLRTMEGSLCRRSRAKLLYPSMDVDARAGGCITADVCIVQMGL